MKTLTIFIFTNFVSLYRITENLKYKINEELMGENKNGLLQIPQGAEGLYMEEAFRHRKITSHIEKIFSLWGYLPVETPVFDFFDTYSHLLNKRKADQTYRLMDREGELLMLRSDITLFLAKQMSLTIKESDLPVRVFYSDTILRYESHEDISNNEFFQSGCELIGKPGIDGDLEIILLLYNLFKELNLRDFKIHIGSRALLNSLCINFPQKDIIKLNDLIDTRNCEKLKYLFMKNGSTESDSTFIVKMLMFIGKPEQFEKFVYENRISIPKTALKEIEYLIQTTSIITSIEEPDCFRIDLSEIGSQDYYTGIVFSAYLNELSCAAASGGRYDSLFNKFGHNASSVGFSMLQRKVETLLGKSEQYAPPKAEGKQRNEKFIEAYKRGLILREKGKTFVL